ncbi:hypothetical protein BH10BAC1_BH10BAC1_16420 [soil metagenome]
MKKASAKEETKVVKAPFDARKMNRRNMLFFFLLCFLVYGKGIGNEYSMDDEFVIKNNVQVQKGIKAIPEIFNSTYVVDNQKASYEYRPIVKATFAVEYQFYGLKPHVSHFINILLYALSILLLYSLLLELLSNYNRLFPFLVTLLFLIHPLHSEVVLSLKNRDVILSFIGCLFALKFYLRYAGSNKIYDLLFGAFFLLFALMSKKDSMTFYAIIPFTVWFFRNISWKKIGIIVGSFLVPKIILFLATSNAAHLAKKVMIGTTVITGENGITRQYLDWENPLFINSTFLQRIPTGFYSIYFYLKMYFIPHPLLSYYGYNQVPIATWSNPIVWVVILFLLVIGYYVVKNYNAKKIEVYGILFFLTTISMFTNVLQPVVGIVAERFAYIPSLGLSIVAAWALLKIGKVVFENKEFKFPQLSSSFLITIVLITIVYGGRTFARIPAWKNSFTLYETDAQNATESAHANSLYAAACIQKIKETPKMNLQDKRVHVSNAEKYYLKSLEISPDYISSLNNLGMIYFTYFNKPEKAIPYLTKAIKLDTNYVEAYFNLATCEAKTQKYDLAEKHYLKTLEIDSKFMSTYLSLSSMYAEEKKYDEILKLNKDAINKGIKGDVLNINIGNVYFVRGDTLSAIPYLEEGIRLNPNNKLLNSFLANYFKEKGDLEKANKYYDNLSTIKR